MNPIDVQTNKFKPVKILSDHDGFAIAIGETEDGDVAMGMRWNGDEESPIGFPQTYGNPTWLILPDHVSEVMSIALLFMKDNEANHAEILSVLAEVYKKEKVS